MVNLINSYKIYLRQKKFIWQMDSELNQYEDEMEAFDPNNFSEG